MLRKVCRCRSQFSLGNVDNNPSPASATEQDSRKQDPAESFARRRQDQKTGLKQFDTSTSYLDSTEHQCRRAALVDAEQLDLSRIV